MWNININSLFYFRSQEVFSLSEKSWNSHFHLSNRNVYLSQFLFFFFNFSGKIVYFRVFLALTVLSSHSQELLLCFHVNVLITSYDFPIQYCAHFKPYMYFKNMLNILKYLIH